MLAYVATKFKSKQDDLYKSTRSVRKAYSRPDHLFSGFGFKMLPFMLDPQILVHCGIC